jgi:hypothetical protein
MLSLRRERDPREVKPILEGDLRAIKNLKRGAGLLVAAGLVALVAGVILFSLGIVSLFTPAWGAGIFLIPFSCLLMVGGCAVAAGADAYRDKQIKKVQQEAKAVMEGAGLSQ